MSLVTLFLIAVGLSADAFAVALGKGLQMKRLSGRGVLALALTFGLFQGLMPVLGWAVATGFRDYVTSIDHWIAFVLLAAIGGKMIWEAFGDDDEDDGDGRVPFGELMLLGVATSIDALAVGISFAFLDVSVAGAATLIGVTTFVLTAVGVWLGHRAGVKFRGPAEVVGGLVLIGIGLKILLEHTGVI
ncbi:manganese efflux pump MntP family protein [Nocardioides plantarum]|uniref:Putative manganese efflux pump MntP n=1 Tax=Nocardioides plantarum TaxID=29299 RepID=A0ABV5K9S2_9ACTN|nr:manganese efflux pump MntP family protein [Nocardioides plantarum]